MQDGPVGIAMGQAGDGAMGMIADRIGQFLVADGQFAPVGNELRGDAGRVLLHGRCHPDAEGTRHAVQIVEIGCIDMPPGRQSLDGGYCIGFRRHERGCAA